MSIRRFPPPEHVASIACDATDESSVSVAFAELNRRWGTIDHLVNLVGFTKERTTVEDLSPIGKRSSTECNPSIRVNAIAPGIVDTEFLVGGTGRERRGGNLELDAVVQQIPMRRAGRTEDIAAMALFLANPAASYITAQTIHINGGLWS